MLIAAATLLVALVLAGDSPHETEARPFEIDLATVQPVFPEYLGLFRDSLAQPPEPYTPQSLPAGMRDHERGSWKFGHRRCRGPWHEVVATAGLTGLVPASPPESRDALRELAWKLLYANSPGLELSEINTSNFNWTVQGCLDGLLSRRSSGAVAGGSDAAP
jgi:hypothetical protein